VSHVPSNCCLIYKLSHLLFSNATYCFLYFNRKALRRFLYQSCKTNFRTMRMRRLAGESAILEDEDYRFADLESG
jgi:hypothetical protein